MKMQDCPSECGTVDTYDGDQYYDVGRLWPLLYLDDSRMDECHLGEYA